MSNRVTLELPLLPPPALSLPPEPSEPPPPLPPLWPPLPPPSALPLPPLRLRLRLRLCAAGGVDLASVMESVPALVCGWLLKAKGPEKRIPEEILTLVRPPTLK